MSKRSSSGLGSVTSDDLSKPIKISKPSLDSDEEDYQDDVFRLREADIDGQENATLEFDGSIKITPFNMKEELEEDGHFDSSGNFIFKKVTDARDNWLEDVDWVEVNRRQTSATQLKETSVSDEPSAPDLDNTKRLEIYRELLNLMRPKETVLLSIKRMGSGSTSAKSASASQRWLKKKSTVVTQNSEGNPEGLLKATELADLLLQAGDFDAYQKTYEDLDTLIQTNSKANGNDGDDDDDELDKLGKELDVGKGIQVSTDLTKESTEMDQVRWDLKRSNAPDAPIEGPYDTMQLKRWMEKDAFKDSECVLVRQTTKTDGQFYNIHRIDFDLYE